MTDEAPPDIAWTAAWGEDVKEGDLLRLNKLGGPVRVKSMRRWIVPADKRGPVQPDEEPPWHYGVIVEDREGGQYHMYLQPSEAVFIALNVPADIEIPEGDSGSDE